MRGRGDLGLRHAGLGKPLGRQVDAAVGGVVDHVAGDVGELEGEAEILGAAQGGEIVRLHAHHERHHHAHHSRHVPAVVERVLEGLVAPRRHVHGEAVEQLDGVAFGDVAGAGPRAGRRRSRDRGGLAGQRAPGLRIERLPAAPSPPPGRARPCRGRGPGRRSRRRSAGTRRRASRRRRGSGRRRAPRRPRSSWSPSGWSRGWSGRGRRRAKARRLRSCGCSEVGQHKPGGRLGRADHARHASARVRARADEVEVGDHVVSVVGAEPGALGEDRLQREGRALPGAQLALESPSA